MILTMVGEPLVIAIKLADRLHNMRTVWVAHGAGVACAAWVCTWWVHEQAHSSVGRLHNMRTVWVACGVGLGCRQPFSPPRHAASPLSQPDPSRPLPPRPLQLRAVAGEAGGGGQRDAACVVLPGRAPGHVCAQGELGGWFASVCGSRGVRLRAPRRVCPQGEWLVGWFRLVGFPGVLGVASLGAGCHRPPSPASPSCLLPRPPTCPCSSSAERAGGPVLRGAAAGRVPRAAARAGRAVGRAHHPAAGGPFSSSAPLVAALRAAAGWGGVPAIPQQAFVGRPAVEQALPGTFASEAPWKPY